MTPEVSKPVLWKRPCPRLVRRRHAKTRSAALDIWHVQHRRGWKLTCQQSPPPHHHHPGPAPMQHGHKSRLPAKRDGASRIAQSEDNNPEQYQEVRFYEVCREDGGTIWVQGQQLVGKCHGGAERCLPVAVGGGGGGHGGLFANSRLIGQPQRNVLHTFHRR